jgi:hypothetical protein
MLGHSQGLPYACAGNMESYGVQGFLNSVYFWEVDGGNIVSGQNNDTIILRWDYSRRNHALTVIEQTEYGCFGIPVEASISVNAPVADIGDNEEICQDDLHILAQPAIIPGSLTRGPMAPHLPSMATPRLGSVRHDGCADYDSAY